MKEASSNRREFLSTSAKVAGAITAAGTALNPCDKQASAQDQTGTLAQQRVGPNDQLTLGVIGIGPTCRYDSVAMLKFDDIRCIAIANVQESRQERGRSESTAITATQMVIYTMTFASCSIADGATGVIRQSLKNEFPDACRLDQQTAITGTTIGHILESRQRLRRPSGS